MSKLEDIPKKDFFTVPEGYFDMLPLKIQARIEASEPQRRIQQPVLRYALTYALPLLVAAIVVFFSTRSQPNAEAMLASVETAALVQYLAESELTTEDMLESVDLGAEELEALENEVYDISLEAVDTETLNSEFNSIAP